MSSESFVVLGAGVIGLSTALSIVTQYSNSSITIIAQHFPGDYDIKYTSPWAGANWCSSATDTGLLEQCDRVTYNRFADIAERHPEAGIRRSPLKMIFDSDIDDAGILSQETKKIWYENLVGGLDAISEADLPEGAKFGMEMRSTFVINSQAYLQWLLAQAREKGIKLLRAEIGHIDDISTLFKDLTAVFNCTGLGAYYLGGVCDKKMYPTRGQIVLVQQPLQPLTKMYFRSPRRVDENTTYVFQRPLGGGVILGGCRQDGNWSSTVDLDFAEDIKRRCCELTPELGDPRNLKVISHGVGLRPGRRGGPRLEAERRLNGLLIIHNYGAGGAGYQASWGMGEYAVKLVKENLGQRVAHSRL